MTELIRIRARELAAVEGWLQQVREGRRKTDMQRENDKTRTRTRERSNRQEQENYMYQPYNVKKKQVQEQKGYEDQIIVLTIGDSDDSERQTDLFVFFS